MSERKIRLGGGAGYSGDRIEPAVDLAKRGQLDYLIFECLAERTIALAQKRRLQDPDQGYDPLLTERMYRCIPECHQRGVRIITNMGAANPVAAMKQTLEVCRHLNLRGIKIAAVTGDDIPPQHIPPDATLLETGARFETIRDRVISANAYLGASPLIESLEAGANVIITGRVADPVLFTAPVIHAFGWSMDDWDLMGKAVLMGHLMECAGHVTGGYFADPGIKDVENLADLGFPIAEIDSKGEFTVSKLPGTGGQVTEATCKEQLLYEIHDPAQYYTPDVIADLSHVTIKDVEKDKVRLQNGRGKPRSGKLKVSIGYRDGFIGEGQISYGGPGAEARARLAGKIVKTRLNEHAGYDDLRIDLIGSDALYRSNRGSPAPFEIRLRVAGKASDRELADLIGREVEALYTNGPAAGGGAMKSVKEVIAIQSVLIDASEVKPTVHYKTT